MIKPQTATHDFKIFFSKVIKNDLALTLKCQLFVFTIIQYALIVLSSMTDKRKCDYNHVIIAFNVVILST